MTELIGWIGSALVVLSLTQRNLRRLRQVNLVASLVLLTFNLIVAIPSMVALNVVLATVNIRHLVQDRRGGIDREVDERPDGEPGGPDATDPAVAPTEARPAPSAASTAAVADHDAPRLHTIGAWYADSRWAPT
ncbi:MAG: hypothetical protein S0880_19190 [Actinomycetota bacterium]|nr:hypothetical protein [Actinomycetota bacterium]